MKDQRNNKRACPQTNLFTRFRLVDLQTKTIPADNICLCNIQFY